MGHGAHHMCLCERCWQIILRLLLVSKVSKAKRALVSVLLSCRQKPAALHLINDFLFAQQSAAFPSETLVDMKLYLGSSSEEGNCWDCDLWDMMRHCWSLSFHNCCRWTNRGPQSLPVFQRLVLVECTKSCQTQTLKYCQNKQLQTSSWHAWIRCVSLFYPTCSVATNVFCEQSGFIWLHCIH